METSISLGFNCLSAVKGVEMGSRKRKAEGYNTCPFDIGLTNYEGIMLCLKEDFKYFCDLTYLKVVPFPFSGGVFNKGDLAIYNTRYNFIFNHESPYGNLYSEEGWSGGINHFTENNFERFIERYNKRIDNFRNYMKESSKITFIISKMDFEVTELKNQITNCYPHLNFEIYSYLTEETGEVFYSYDKLMKYYNNNDNIVSM
uniref:Uncharacterized protein n=1 Tax=viral metagenome TaxID=1070528 RepID=A0A6C0JEP9_9ZZZZ